MEKFIPYAHQSINEDDRQAVSAALKQEWITRGPQVEAFEKAISDYCGATFAVAFSSGTAALMAAYSAAGMAPGDRLITTPNTFVATVGAGIHLGATPVFVDIDSNTGNANLEQMIINTEYKTIRSKTFLAPVHFGGIAIDVRALQTQIRSANSRIIEDAAHAIGSSYPDGKKVGSCAYSDMTIFSFHPAKTITSGEGGMVTTNDPELYHKLVRYRNNGIERKDAWFYEVQEITGNYHMTEMQGALGLSQFKRLETFVDHRRALVKRYRKKLAGLKHLQMMTDQFDNLTAYHLFVVLIDFEALKKSRSEVMDALRSNGIGTQLHYIPVYRHPVLQKSIGDISSYFPNMEKHFQQALSLPMYYDLTFEDIDSISNSLASLKI